MSGFARKAEIALGLPAADQWLLAEASAALFAARLRGALPFRVLARRLGGIVAPGTPVDRVSLSAEQEAAVRAVRWAVRRAAWVMPFRAVCLQQALAGRAMLARRGVGSVLHLGVRSPADANLAAHAWLNAGGLAVTGYPVDPTLVEVGRFVARPGTRAGARGRLKRVPGLVRTVRRARALATPLGRGRVRAAMRGAAILQPETVTRSDRHPALFALVRERLADRAAPRLLSYGCSTGEEAFTLADYLPGARIDAVDANPACIARARRAAKARGSAIRFLAADSPDAVAPACYDAVLCLSVLRHARLDAERPERCTALLPFARFAEMVAALDRRVAVGGMLVLWGCNFRFTDTATAARYRIVPVPGMRPQSGPFYGPDDARLPDADYAAFAFVRAA